MSSYLTSSGQWLDETIEAMRLVMPDLLGRERELAHKKWFAYRFMTPLAATQLFAELYRVGLKAYVRAHKDRDEADRVNGLSPHIFLGSSGSLTELWKARQRADELGLPYDLLIDFGFHFAGRRRWKRAPRPIQLFGSKGSDIAWPLEIEKYLEERLPMSVDRVSDLPQYRVEHFRGLPVQCEFRDYLTNHIRTSDRRWTTRLSGPCVRERYLRLLTGLRLAPQGQRHGILSDIRADLESGLLVRAPFERLPGIAFVPACFGMPAATDTTASTCRACPLADKCARMGAIVSAETMKRHGSISRLKDDRDNKRREGQRRRTARHRARKKAASAVSVVAA